MSSTPRSDTRSSYAKALLHMKEAARLLGFKAYAMSDSVRKDEKFIGFFLVADKNFNVEETELYLDKYLTPLEGDSRGRIDQFG